MDYGESINSYSEIPFDNMDNIVFVGTPDSQWLVTETSSFIVTETLYSPQISVGYTNFLVVKDIA